MRRDLMILSAAVLLLVLAPALPPGSGVAPGSASLAAADWPQFLGPHRDGTCAAGELEGGVAAAPRVIWRRDVGEGFSGPVVAGDKVILVHRVEDEDVIECMELAGGATVWRAPAPTKYRDSFGFDNGPRATPAVSAGRVVAHGAEGLLRAVELATGRTLWSVATHEVYDVPESFFGVAVSPLVDGDRVLLNVGGRDGAGVVAFAADSGKVLWKATSHEASYSSPVVATIRGERHALFFTRSGLLSLDPAGGAVRFEVPWRPRIHASVNAATPLVLGDRVFISTSYGKGATLLEVRSGKDRPSTVWASDDAMTNHYATAVARDGFLYGYHGRQEYQPDLRCVEAATGKVRWSRDGFGGGSVILAGDRLILAREGGEVVVAAASPDGFEAEATLRVLEPTVRAYPALAGGRLFLRNEKELVCVDLRAAKAPREGAE
jgi:outer membrane protein assembly factor BamB